MRRPHLAWRWRWWWCPFRRWWPQDIPTHTRTHMSMVIPAIYANPSRRANWRRVVRVARAQKLMATHSKRGTHTWIRAVRESYWIRNDVYIITYSCANAIARDILVVCINVRLIDCELAAVRSDWLNLIEQSVIMNNLKFMWVSWMPYIIKMRC